MNILCLTNEYPNKNYPKKDSPWIVPYFAREWVKMGHNVIVIVNSSKFLKVCYYGVNLIKPLLMRKYNITQSNLSDQTWAKEFEFVDEGVSVYNRPMLKLVPSANFSDRVVNKQISEIAKILKEESFVPDVITGHWLNPQLRLIYELSRIYSCKTAIVFHGEVTPRYISKYNVERYISAIANVGCRSKTNAELLQKNLKLKRMPFVCPSGIPDKYIAETHDDLSRRSFDKKYLSIISAGRLVYYKRFDSLIKAFAAQQSPAFDSLTIVGEGQLQQKLEQLSLELGCSQRVLFTGRIERDQLQKRMRESDIFVLISEREVFGLVYVEAMLQGCIVIGAKGGGIDGIIIDGVNGFLCNQGDSDELAGILCKIAAMPRANLQKISKRAIQTAQRYTDSEVAKMYIANICK